MNTFHMVICLRSAKVCKPIGLVNLSVREEMSYSVYIEYFAYINDSTQPDHTCTRNSKRLQYIQKHSIQSIVLQLLQYRHRYKKKYLLDAEKQLCADE